MFETPITVVGNIVTEPDRRRVGDQEVFKFRVASNSRRRTPTATGSRATRCSSPSTAGAGWSPASAPRSGRVTPVIVVGYVYTSEYEDREGVRRSSVEVRATSVGPDLARCIARIEKRRHPTQQRRCACDRRARTSADGERPTTAADEADADAVGGEALPLSA